MSLRRHTIQDWPAISAARTIVNPETGCIEWTGPTCRKGCGLCTISGRQNRVHRIAYAATNGQIPPGAHALHKCDNRKCCNPDHVYLGNNADNIADKIARDRSGKKLNTQKAREVIEMVASGMTQTEVAALMGISQPVVSRIASGRRWAHVQTAGV